MPQDPKYGHYLPKPKEEEREARHPPGVPRYVSSIFPPSSQTGHFNQPPGRDDREDYQLSSEGRNFGRSVKVFDMVGCAAYISKYPEVLKEHYVDHKYAREATAALKAGDDQLAESYIEKLLIVRGCRNKSSNEQLHFFKPLVDCNKKAWERFDGEVGKILRPLRRELSAASKSPAPKAPDTEPEVVRPPLDNDRSRHTKAVGMSERLSRTHLESEPRPHGSPQYQTSPHVVTTTAGGRRDSNYYPVAPKQGSGGRHEPFMSDEPVEEILSQQSEMSLGRPPTLRGGFFPGFSGDIQQIVAVENTLDPRYRKMTPQEWGNFFRVGRVFSMLWHIEKTGRNNQKPVWTNTFKGMTIFSHIRRFAVVKVGHGFSWCIGINTYEGQGLKKRGFNQEDINAHAIVYNTGKRPMMLNGEPSTPKQPIEVLKASDDDAWLEVGSRIDFSRVHTIEHNVTVRDVGTVTRTSRPHFDSYWNQYKHR